MSPVFKLIEEFFVNFVLILKNRIERIIAVKISERDSPVQTPNSRKSQSTPKNNAPINPMATELKALNNIGIFVSFRPRKENVAAV